MSDTIRIWPVMSEDRGMGACAESGHAYYDDAKVCCRNNSFVDYVDIPIERVQLAMMENQDRKGGVSENGIMDDERKIKALFLPNGDEISVEHSVDDKKIEPYYENGQCAQVVWFKIWNGDKLSQRINGAMVEGVVYLTRVSDDS